jgi:hypothetical protein
MLGSLMALRSRGAVRSRLVGLVLLALALRSLIPMGFMPAGDGTLSLIICPGDLPAGLFQGRGMGQDRGQDMSQGMSQGMRPAMPMAAGTRRMPGQPHHGKGLMDGGYCAFTTGFSPAPPPLLLVAIFLLLSCAAIIAVTVLAPAGIRLVHLPQARAPPAPR